MTAYYNENEPFAAQWLRNLIAAGHIAKGQVDDRSIVDVSPGDLAGFAQCHFFAGLGGWYYALRLAGWPDERPVWTGSCPCQPFSAAGARRGDADERHLWPTWARLVRECRPECVFGEQVAGHDGRAWLDAVFADLEGLGYAVAAADLCAAGVGAPHIRQRLYWMADAGGARLEKRSGDGGIQREAVGVPARQTAVRGGDSGDVAYTDYRGQPAEPGLRLRGTAFHDVDGCGPLRGRWAAADWIGCRDGRWRPVEPGAFPVVDGTPERMDMLRAYGNAIVPPLAAAFVSAYLDVIAEDTP